MLTYILAVLLTAPAAKGRPAMDKPFIQEFKARIGFARLADVDPALGVRANWDELPKVLSALVKNKRPSESTNLRPGGLGGKDYSWQFRDDSFLIEIFVSGLGSPGAQRVFLDRLSSSSRGALPYELRREQVGDLAIHYPAGPNTFIMWIYRNVLVHIINDENRVDLAGATRAIQRFMEDHAVQRLVDHLPVVDQVKVSKKEIHVGDEFKVTIVLGKNTTPESLETDFTSSIDAATGKYALLLVSDTPLEATFKARIAGKATIDVEVMDRKTLLSPPLSITVDVLPPR